MRIAEISAKEAAELLKSQPEVKLLDVRTDDEARTAKIAGSILVNDDKRLREVLAWPKNTLMVVHCHHGGRSRRACGFFMSKGFKNVLNLAGGIDSWSKDIDPKIPRY